MSYEEHFCEIILIFIQRFSRCHFKIFLSILLHGVEPFGRGHYEEYLCEILHLKVLFNISYLELWWPSCSAELNHLGKFGRGHYGEPSCEIILNSDQWFRRCRFNIYSSGEHLVPCSVTKWRNFGNEEHLCEILNLDQWFR